MEDSVVTYAEVRQWVVWLRVFTASELADVMAIDVEVAQRFIRAAEWHGMIEDTEISFNGVGPEETLWQWTPLPPGPTHHFHFYVPEWRDTSIGCYELAPVRGMPIRIRSRDRKGESTPGQAHRIKMKNRAYEREKLAREKRAEDARNKRVRKESYLGD